MNRVTAEQLAELRGQSVEGSFYLAECGYCGEMYPSNKLTGGEPLFSGDYGECYCPLCGAEDTDIADCGAWGSEAVTAWNYQQKRVEALLDELERKDKRIAELEARTVTVRLPERKGDSDGSSTSEFDYGWNASAAYRDEQWKTALTKAGINLTVEV
ncbi:hypothetical protein [Atlantibacter hermannii]|uniref:hypothetical protein n=1 Tax=Atlantibacter hermannii TaxID=565 RepID=UPI0028964BCB|nr:hypothetical protein [Atlantibacter hermannii]